MEPVRVPVGDLFELGVKIPVGDKVREDDELACVDGVNPIE